MMYFLHGLSSGPVKRWHSAVLASALFCAGAAAAPGAPPAADATAPRERRSINQGWRFQKDDPAGSTVKLDYDVRPEVNNRRDDGPADAKPTEAVRPAGDAGGI